MLAWLQVTYTCNHASTRSLEHLQECKHMEVTKLKVTSAGPSGVVVADASAIAAGLERLVLEFDKVRRPALHNAHLGPRDAYLLRLAAQPDGVRLGLFRDRVGLTDQRASQIRRALEERLLVRTNRDTSYGRVRVVSATRKGHDALARFDDQLAEALQAELAKGEASSLLAAVAAVRLTSAASIQAAEGHEERKSSRTRKSGKAKRIGHDGPTLMDALDHAQ